MQGSPTPKLVTRRMRTEYQRSERTSQLGNNKKKNLRESNRPWGDVTSKSLDTDGEGIIKKKQERKRREKGEAGNWEKLRIAVHSSTDKDHV